MDAKVRATAFVKKYSGLFSEDQDLWIERIAHQIYQAEIDTLKETGDHFVEVLHNASKNICRL